MAQSGYTPVLIYGSATASATPSAANLTTGTSGVELALNYTDGILYYKDNAGTVQRLASKAAAGALTTPFTANGVVYASSTSALTTGSALTFDGTHFNVNTSITNGIFNIGANSATQNAIAFKDTQPSGNTWVTGPGVGTGSVSDFSLYNATSSAFASLYTDGSSGKWVWYTNGSEQMRLTSTGLGIGTTSPSGKINLSTAAGVATKLWFSQAATNAWSVGTPASTDALVFINEQFSSEKMRIDSSGNLLVGVTSYNAAVNSNYFLYGSGLVSVGHVSGTSSGSAFQQFVYNATQIGSITQSGTTGVLYNITSDYRLKNVVGAVSGSGDRIDALQPVEYTMKADGSQHRGFLAHQFQTVYANSVNGTKDAVDADGKPVYQTMQASTSEVIADLVAEIQSLRARLKAANIA